MPEPSLSSLIFFQAAGETMALPLSSVREVVLPGSPVRVPRAPFACLGAMDLRGERLPLLALGAMLGLERVPKAEQLEQRLIDGHVLVVDAEGLSFALLVDRAVEISEDGAATIEKQRPNQAGLGRALQFVAGTAIYGEQRAWLLKANELLLKGRRHLLQRVANLS
jgi:chemotaxis signal transduction protein